MQVQGFPIMQKTAVAHKNTTAVFRSSVSTAYHTDRPVP